MKNLIIVLIVAVVAILNVACTDSKTDQVTPAVSVDTTKMFVHGDIRHLEKVVAWS